MRIRRCAHVPRTYGSHWSHRSLLLLLPRPDERAGREGRPPGPGRPTVAPQQRTAICQALTVIDTPAGARVHHSMRPTPSSEKRK